jgi:hypothetical protein
MALHWGVKKVALLTTAFLRRRCWDTVLHLFGI